MCNLSTRILKIIDFFLKIIREMYGIYTKKGLYNLHKPLPYVLSHF